MRFLISLIAPGLLKGNISKELFGVFLSTKINQQERVYSMANLFEIPEEKGVL